MRAPDGLKSFQQLLLGARRDARLEQSVKGQTVEGRLAELNRGIDVVPFEIDRRVICFEPQIESRIIDSEFFEVGKRGKHCEGRGHADADNPSSLPII